jgi:predicted alpha/beta-fold hydrolase
MMRSEEPSAPIIPEFQPLPLLGNPHLQTLLAHIFKGPVLTVATQNHRIELADGDQLVLHDTVSPRWHPGQPIAILIHGLGGTHRSGCVQRQARLLLKRGWRVVRLDLRGCGHGFPLARRPYHAGCSDDLRRAAAVVHRWSPASPLVLIGFSLGGNIVLKLAGEAAAHPVPGLKKVAAVSPPIDLERSAGLLALPRNRFYEVHFLRELLKLAQRRQRLFPDLPPVRFPRYMTLRLFDEMYIAPRCGFADALDYYRRAAALPFIERITVPTLIMTASDDPMIAVEPFRQLSAPKQVEVRILSKGGHLGFLGWDGAGGIRWAEQRVADWVS